MEAEPPTSQMSIGDQTALPKARGQRLILLASPSCDQNRVGRKCTLRTDRGEPSAGRSCGVEECSLPRRSMRNSEPQESLRPGHGSAKSAPICGAKNPIEG